MANTKLEDAKKAAWEADDWLAGDYGDQRYELGYEDGFKRGFERGYHTQHDSQMANEQNPADSAARERAERIVRARQFVRYAVRMNDMGARNSNMLTEREVEYFAGKFADFGGAELAAKNAEIERLKGLIRQIFDFVEPSNGMEGLKRHDSLSSSLAESGWWKQAEVALSGYTYLLRMENE